MKLKASLALVLLVAPLEWVQAESVYVPEQGERLSALLMRIRMLPGDAKNEQGEALQLSGMVLKRASLLQSQTLQKTRVQTRLATMESGKVPAYLHSLVKTMPVTGRQLLPTQDAHEMAARKNLDPLLQAADLLVLRPLHAVVAVMTDQGMCQARFKSEVSIPAYLEQCVSDRGRLDRDAGRDHAWLIQPSGKVSKLGVASWNMTPQALPEPGAWVWSPSRQSGWADEDSEELVRFLQTQGAFTGVAESMGQAVMVAAPEPDLQQALQANLLQRKIPSRSDWGTVGLFQMPSARMAEEGTISLTASRVEPYSRYSFIYQPFAWLEAGFRYSIITNQTFGSFEFSGDRKFQDKSVDVKLRLLEESAWMPEMAIGLRDIGGTGLFAGEYLVGSKRWGALDFTLGMGFGYLANGGRTGNPFSFLAEEFSTRPRPDLGQGGNANSSTYFRGDTALFGGLEWHTPIRNLILKLERDGNDYTDEPRNNPLPRSDSRINYGLVYRLNDSVDFAVSVQRGNTVGFSLAFNENVSRYSVPKLSDPKPVEVTEGPRPKSVNWANTTQRVQEQTNWDVTGIQQRGGEVQLTVKNADTTYPARAVDRAATVLHESLPDEINWLSFVYQHRGLNLAEHLVERKKWASDKIELPVADASQSPAVVAVEPNTYPYMPLFADKERPVSGSLGLGYEQTFGGANGYLFQFTAYASGEAELTPGTWITGRIDHVLGGTFDKFTQPGTSGLPQVRTNFRQYAVASDTRLTNLQLNHMGQLAESHFYSLYGGYLESMFGGVGAEYLYRPMNSRVALGVDLNRVKQRAFEQNFDFRDYSVNTGHVTAYVDTGFEDILATVSAGQYLAGDLGVTVDLSRVFKNGVKIGAYASKTNVSAEDFGEGSFDKGIYLSVPFDALFTRTVPGEAGFNWVQVTRDGGAKLGRGFRLFEETASRAPRALWYSPN